MSCVRPGASSDGSWMPVGAGAARATARLPRHSAEGDPFRRSADVIGPICQRLERFAKDGAVLRCNPPDSKRATILAPQNCLLTGPCTRDHGSGTQAFAPGVATPGANALVIRLSSAEQWQHFLLKEEPQHLAAGIRPAWVSVGAGWAAAGPRVTGPL